MMSRRTIVLAPLVSAISAIPANAEVKEFHMSPLTPTELMMHSTVRIECVGPNNTKSSGTGFFFNLFVSGEQSVPVIVTNKHVLLGNDKAIFFLTLANTDGAPQLGKMERVEILNLSGQWIGHPDPNVDLAIIPTATLFHTLANQGKRPFVVSLDQSLIPADSVLKSLTPVEDVLVVGYPDGIWDSHNNAPIFRRGITATAPYIPFNGQTVFLIDCSIFPGSSGSPVFLFNSGGWTDRNGGMRIGSRILFLGVVYAVAQHTVAGELIIVQAPTNTKSVPVSAIPNNLGICVMAARVLDFDPVLVRAGLFTTPPGYRMRSTLPK